MLPRRQRHGFLAVCVGLRTLLHDSARCSRTCHRGMRFHGGFRFCRKNPFFQKTPRKPSAKAFSAGAIFQTVFLCCTPVRHAGLPASARNNRILPHPGQPAAVWLFLPSGAFCLWRIHRHGDDLHPVSRRADQFDCCPAHADHLLRGRFE